VQALAALDASAQGPAKAVANPAEPSPRHQALKTLRYLGTASAAKELARHLRGEDTNFDFECMFGLVGSPQHEAALSEMRRLLADPDHPVTDLFLVTMSVLSLSKDESPEVLRPQRQQRFQAIHAEFLDDLPHKRGNALAVSLYTALNQVGPQQAIPREKSEELAAQLPAIFDRLPVENQYELLAYRWDSLRSPALLPLLRKYAQTYQDFPIPNEIHAYNANNLSGTALVHWYELAPEEVRAAILQEILRPKPRFNAQTLGILPDETLPEVEQSLIEHFSSNDEDYWISANLASVIQRYATAAILPRMLAIVDKNVGKWACAIQEPALAYLLRVDPVAARSRIEAATAARGEGYTACNHSLLAQVGTLYLDPLLEEIALRSLNDDDPEVAANAAGFLGRFGSPATEERLWERLAQWSARWHGRESELIYIAGGTNPNGNQGTLGTSLQQAISSGEAWLADKAKLQKLQQLSIGKSMRQPIDGILAKWDHKPWRIQCLHFSSGPQFDVLQYHLKSLNSLRNKLSQFPSGSFGPRLPPRPLPKAPKTLLSYPTSSRRTECPCATKRFPDLPTRLPRVRLHKSFAKGDTERSFLPSDVLEIAVRQKDQEGSDRNQTADRGDWGTSVQLNLEAITTTKSDLYGPNGPRYFFPSQNQLFVGIQNREFRAHGISHLRPG
jgi:hypothetical protein